MSVQVGVIMGSKSDWETMKQACDVLDELQIPYEKKVVSAHRTPDLMFEYAETAATRLEGHYRGSRRRCTFAGHGRSQNDLAGYRRACQVVKR